jgi:hypothetical protein
MSEPRISRRQILKTAGALGVIGALSPSATALGSEDEGEDGTRYRWDIISLSRGPNATVVISPGGSASAAAEDKSMITVTGSGTFRLGHPKAVTGGGTWSTTGAAGAGSGTYQVTSLVDFDVAPGTAPSPPFTDNVNGKGQNARAGLVFLQVAYSDGSDGVLVVSCHLPAGSPDAVFEGITASKGFVDYWMHNPASGSPDTANAGRTQFHILPQAESD